MTATQWHGILAYEDTTTLDGRNISVDATHWPARPLPLLAIGTHDIGHYGNRIVGTIDRIFREGTTIKAEGTLDPAGTLGVLDVVGALDQGPIPGGIDLHRTLTEVQHIDGEATHVVKHGEIAAFTIYLNGASESAFAEGTWIAEGPWPAG